MRVIPEKLSKSGGISLLITICVFFGAAIPPHSAAGADFIRMGNLSDPDERRRAVEMLTKRNRERKERAWEIALSQGWKPRWKANGKIYELMAIENGKPYVYHTCNQDAAISINTNLVRNTLPFDVNGLGRTVGIWDGALVRNDHQELAGRVDLIDTGSYGGHATHVAGTIGAAGVESLARGMAPRVYINSYDWYNDTAEVTYIAMASPGEPDKIQTSNHSYGITAGWYYESSSSTYNWYGTWGDRESDYFGRYGSEAAQWDEICYDAPYILPFKVTGNDRNDQAPDEGEEFQYYRFPKWRTKNYDISTDPYDDGWDKGGFDTILPIGNAKNLMTVGGVSDAVSSGSRDISQADMTSFSGWGPTDDGRIKPDIVTNATSVYSSWSSSDQDYSNMTGTSSAAPSAAGSAVLLNHYFKKLFPGDAMRSSTIKALIIHTADDLGNPGPDYKFGWGLMNTEAAAEQIRLHYHNPDELLIKEDLLTDSLTYQTYTFKWDGESSIWATICWTDPPANELSGLDDPDPRLINDLDLRIIDPCGIVHYPFVLNPDTPDQPADTNDNTIDNIEQVEIPSPNLYGTYTMEVSYKETLENNQQYYSLILSGQLLEELRADFNDDGIVDYYDLDTLTEYWLQNEPSVDVAPETPDGIIDFLDFAVLADEWRKG